MDDCELSDCKDFVSAHANLEMTHFRVHWITKNGYLSLKKIVLEN